MVDTAVRDEHIGALGANLSDGIPKESLLDFKMSFKSENTHPIQRMLKAWVDLCGGKEQLKKDYRRMAQIIYCVPKLSRKMKKAIYGTKRSPKEPRLEIDRMNDRMKDERFEDALDLILGD